MKAIIVREITQQKYRAALKSVMDSAHADFNEQYFGPMAPKPPIELRSCRDARRIRELFASRRIAPKKKRGGPEEGSPRKGSKAEYGT